MEVCTHNHTSITTYALGDPTRTASLRNAFVRDSNRRFNELIAVIRKAVGVEDVLGIRKERRVRSVSIFQLATPGPGAFAFPRSQDKIEAFMRWLNTQEQAGLLQTITIPQVGAGIESGWTNKYIGDSYKRGVIRARYELRKAGFNVPGIDQTGGIGMSMGTPFHIDRLGLLFSRAFTELKGITAAMDLQISRVLAQGLADGDGPALLARKLVSTINGVGMGDLGIRDSLGRFIPAKRRAQIMARTEMIRAHHQATIQEYRNWGVEGVRVKAEWVTAGDNRVCDLCNALEREVFTLDTINGMIPLHPNCRCIALPYKGAKTEAWRKDPVAKHMKDPAHSEKYFNYKQGYKQKMMTDLDEAAIRRRSVEITKDSMGHDNLQLTEALEKFMWEDSSLLKMHKAMKGWAKETFDESAMALKIWARRVEYGMTKIRFKVGSMEEVKKIYQFANEYMTADDYLRIRAFNQAYMEVIQQRAKLMFRGIGDPEAATIREAILQEIGLQRTKHVISNGNLVGFSDDVFVSRQFGPVVVRRTVPTSDIIIHRDLFSSYIRSNQGEREWIVKEGKRYYKTVDVRLEKGINPEAMTEVIKDFGEM